jgi:hypothetical protein
MPSDRTRKERKLPLTSDPTLEDLGDCDGGGLVALVLGSQLSTNFLIVAPNRGICRGKPVGSHRRGDGLTARAGLFGPYFSLGAIG